MQQFAVIIGLSFALGWLGFTAYVGLRDIRDEWEDDDWTARMCGLVAMVILLYAIYAVAHAIILV